MMPDSNIPFETGAYSFKITLLKALRHFAISAAVVFLVGFFSMDTLSELAQGLPPQAQAVAALLIPVLVGGVNGLVNLLKNLDK